MNTQEKIRINEIMNQLELIYAGDKSQLADTIYNIEQDIDKKGWTKTIYIEAKRIFEAGIDLEKSLHLKFLIELLKDVLTHSEEIDYMMYNHSAWKGLLNLRSPFEYSITIRKCINCGNSYPNEAIGNFADIGIFNCSKCDQVLVGSLFEANNELKCKNGGTLVFDKCPKCMSKEFTIKEKINPYKYFSNHSFIWKLENCKDQ